MRALLLAALLLGACASEQPKTIWELDRVARDYRRDHPEQADPAAADVCGASRHAGLVGARADAVDRTALPERTRVVCPGCVVTDDYVPARLNLHTDAAGLITSLSCG